MNIRVAIWSNHGNYRIDVTMNIVRIRKARRLSQAELADMIKTTQAHVSRAENGNDGVTLGVYRSIAAALGVRLSDLFTDDREVVEQILIDAYRRLSPGQQRGWEDMAKIVLSDDPKGDPETAPVEPRTSATVVP